MLVKLTRRALAVGALLLTLASAACGGSNSYGTSTASTPASTKVSASSPDSPASSGTQKQLTITAKDFSFGADAVSVAKGDTIAITFKNSGSATHTLAFYSDVAYKNAIAGGDTGSVSGGATKTLTVTADVGLFYRCNIHPTQMQGKIDFKTAQVPGPTPPGTSAAAAQSAPTEAPARAPAAPIDNPPPAPTNPTVPPQAPAVAATPIPPPLIASSPTHAVATPAKTYGPPPYGY